MRDGKKYYGLTDNLDRCLFEHNAGKVLSTKSRRPFVVIYFETVDSLIEARRREKYFKSGFGRKYVENKIKSIV